MSLLLLLAIASAASGQPRKVPVIGYLSVGQTGQEEALKLGLRELGYVEGGNISIEYRWAGRPERLPELASELVRMKVDVIFAPATSNVKAARDATATVPIVFAGVADPIGAGFAASFARPGGNVTGLSAPNIELTPKRLQLLKEAVPSLTRCALVFDPTDPPAAAALREAEAASVTLGIKLQRLEVRSPGDLDAAFVAMARERTGAFLVLTGWLYLHRARIAELALQHRLPGMGDNKGYVEAGLLMTYGVNYADLARRAATLIDKILQGARPADLPIELPTRFDLGINLKTAKAIGVAPPQSLLLRADPVIQ